MSPEEILRDEEAELDMLSRLAMLLEAVLINRQCRIEMLRAQLNAERNQMELGLAA